MNSSWVKVIKLTGSLGVFASLLFIFMQHFFSELIISTLGSERVFIIILSILFIVGIGLIIAIFKPHPIKMVSANNEKKVPSTSTGTKAKKEITVTYKDNAKHDGDNHF